MFTSRDAASAYAGRRVALLTQHGKERVIAPLFAHGLGARVELATGFDTDSLGTFTREVTRRGTPAEAARAKAEQGMKMLGLDAGVGSEGSFGPGPYGVLPWDVELVVLVDQARAITVEGSADGPAHHLWAQVRRRDELLTFATGAAFPEFALSVRPNGPDDPRVRKGLADWPALRDAFDQALAQSDSATVFVETDLRAHLNPTRMRMIGMATKNLIERLRSECPRCRTPGFWVVERSTGLPCRQCGAPTDEIASERWACLKGDYSEERPLHDGRPGNPARCRNCNP